MLSLSFGSHGVKVTVWVQLWWLFNSSKSCLSIRVKNKTSPVPSAYDASCALPTHYSFGVCSQSELTVVSILVLSCTQSVLKWFHTCMQLLCHIYNCYLGFLRSVFSSHPFPLECGCTSQICLHLTKFALFYKFWFYYSCYMGSHFNSIFIPICLLFFLLTSFYFLLFFLSPSHAAYFLLRVLSPFHFIDAISLCTKLKTPNNFSTLLWAFLRPLLRYALHPSNASSSLPVVCYPQVFTEFSSLLLRQNEMCLDWHSCMDWHRPVFGLEDSLRPMCGASRWAQPPGRSLFLPSTQRSLAQRSPPPWHLLPCLVLHMLC